MSGAPRFFSTLSSLLVCLCLFSSAEAQEPNGDATPAEPRRTAAERIADWESSAESAESALENDAAPPRLAADRSALEVDRGEARALAAALTDALAPLQDQLAALGAPPAEGVVEAPEVAARRAELERRIAELSGRRAEAELAATRAAGLVERIAQRQRTLFTGRLLTRGFSVVEPELWTDVGSDAPGLGARIVGGVQAAVAGGPNAAAVWLAALFAILAPLLARALSAFGARRPGVSPGGRAPGASAVEILAPLARAGVVGAIALAAVYVLAPADPTAAVDAPARVFALRGAEAIAAIAFAAAAGLILFGAADKAVARAATFFAASAGLYRAVLDAAEAAGAAAGTLTLLNAVLCLAPAATLFLLVRAVLHHTAGAAVAPAPAPAPASTDSDDEPEPPDASRALERVGVALGFVASFGAPMAAWAGYYALSRHILISAALTAGLIAAAWILYRLALRVADGRGRERDDPAAVRPAGGGLAGALIGFALVLIVAPALALVWGASASDLRSAGESLLEGVPIGDSTFAPSDMLAALTVFLVGFWLTRMFQRTLRRSVLPNTRVEAGAQASIVTGVGYAGVVFTALFALSAGGLDLSNLAIAAAALSVGVGFGLQTIVNNFVSGIILLVERPIKVGDWIAAGGHEGYVRRINVRSTEIETFDRASVIVPNSDLISGVVVNRTHRNMLGRAFLAVGVEYGTKPETVIAILKAAAAAHPRVVAYPGPVATFAGFGDSALNFELRATLRDVNWVLTVESDLRLEILARLEEAGIGVPFPQREVRIVGGGSPSDVAAAAAALD